MCSAQAYFSSFNAGLFDTKNCRIWRVDAAIDIFISLAGRFATLDYLRLLMRDE